MWISDNVLTGYFDDTSLFIVKSLTVTGTFDVSALSSSATLAFPDVTSGTLLVTAATQSDTGAKTFYDTNQSGGGVRVKSGTATDKVMDFDTSAITNSTTRTLSAADRDMDLDLLGNYHTVHCAGLISDASDNNTLEVVLGTGDNSWYLFRAPVALTLTRVTFYAMQGAASPAGVNVGLNLYHGTAPESGTTAPPATLLPILSSAIDLSPLASNGPDTTELADTTGFADATIPAGNKIYLAVSSGSTWPNDSAFTVTIEYKLFQV